MTGPVSSLVGDLVAMAQAFENLPKVERELAEAREQITKDGVTIARLELKLQDRAKEIDELQAKVRSLEVERDDASFRQLEAEDKVATFERLVRGFQTDVGAFLKAIEPPKPEPEVSPMVPPEGGVGSSSLQATDGPQEPSSQPSNVESGESAAGPTATTHDGNVSQTACSENADNGESVSGSTGTEPKPYSGLRYYDHPAFVSLPNWLAGGGTEEDYHWRPTPPPRQFS